MKREEAIHFAECLKNNWTINFADMEEFCDMAIEALSLVRCKDCKHRYMEGTNVVYNCCELNHNKLMSDDWFCADGERIGEINE